MQSGWGEDDTQAFRAAVNAAGHSEREVAASLHEAFGLTTAPPQPTVHRWLTGSVPRSAARRRAIRRYSQHYAPIRIGDTADSAPDPDAWNDRVAELSGEPLLGPRQGELIDAMTRRLGEGEPISEFDRAVFSDLIRILNLDR